MYAQPQTEWGSYIDQLAQDYRTGHSKGLVHGLQKDAIQNAWGARQKVKGWGVDFALVPGRHDKTYLTMTDYGTTGLTGTVYDDPETIPDNLPPKERLARFENMNFSGGNYGPGLYGRGKLLFQASSKTRTIIYDSLTLDGEYRLGIRFQEGRRLQQFPRVLIGQAAKNMLDKQTGGSLEPLRTVGTRITVVEPLDEIVEGIRDGSFMQFIEDTWWEILYKHGKDVKICVVVDDGKEVAKSPSLLDDLVSGSLPPARSYKKENQTVSVKGIPLRVKRICMGKANKPVPDGVRGLYIQRKSMKVGCVELKDTPADLDEFFFGVIELDKEYEDLIAEAEDLVHYSFSAQFSSYRELKKFAQLHYDEFKRQLGYDVDPEETADQKARDALRAAHEKLNEIMKDLGIFGIGAPPRRRREIAISVASVTFPIAGSSRVEIGDTISDLAFRVANRSEGDRELAVTVTTNLPDGGAIEQVLSRNVRLEATKEIVLPALTLHLAKEVYPKHERIECVCRAQNITGETVAQARIPIYIGIEPEPEQEPVQVRLDNIDLPRATSTRVNYGEAIRNLRYTIANRMTGALQIRVAVVTLDPQYENQEIETVRRDDVILGALGTMEVVVPSLEFDEATYGVVGEGRVRLRCRATSLADQGGIEKGTKWVHDVILWLNKDQPGFGIFEDVDTFLGGADQPRSRVRPGSSDGRWVFSLNLTHPQYDALQDDARRRQQYIFELMAREALYVALHIEKFDPFNNEVKQGDEPYSVARAYNGALDRVLATYYEG